MREAILSAPLRLTSATMRGTCKRSTPIPWMVMQKVCYTCKNNTTTTSRLLHAREITLVQIAWLSRVGQH